MALFAAMTLEDWEAVMRTNLRGAFLCIRETTPHMMRQRGGSIVNLSSVNAGSGGQGAVAITPRAKRASTR